MSRTADGSVSAPVEGVPAVYARGQGGLLDVAVDPDFAKTPWVYLSYAEPGEGGGGTAVARGRLEGNALADVQVIFRQAPKLDTGHHFGSRLVFARDGRLFVTAGDRGEMQRAQHLNEGQGKIFSEDLEMLERQQKNLSAFPDRALLKLNIDTGDDWVVRDNYLHDFSMAGGISYGAFMKSGGNRGVFERNLVICVKDAPAGDTRIGLSFFASVGALAGVETKLMRGFLAIGGAVCGEDFMQTGRPLASLGLGALDRTQLQALLRVGFQ